MKKHTIALALATSALAAPAFAGSLEEPIVAAPIAVPAPVITGSDWTGFYAGVQVGRLNGEVSDLDIEGDGTIYGVHLGYDYDLGNFVIGAELDYDQADVDLETAGGAVAATIENVARLKLRAGYDAGQALIYGTAGVAQAEIDILSDRQDGTFYGAGLAYQATSNIIVGGEILKHDFNDLDTLGVDADATTLTLRASFKF